MGRDRKKEGQEVNFHAAGSYPKCPLVGVVEGEGELAFPESLTHASWVRTLSIDMPTIFSDDGPR